nr:hypothetical protein [Tanacetum cinerariifolium]
FCVLRLVIWFCGVWILDIRILSGGIVHTLFDSIDIGSLAVRTSVVKNMASGLHIADIEKNGWGIEKNGRGFEKNDRGIEMNGRVMVLRYHPPQYASQAPSSSNLSISYPPNDIQSSVNHNVYMASSLIPQMEYATTVHQQSEFSSPETALVVLVFQKGDDPIDTINHMMSFLTAVVTLRYPATNNQLRTSSNPRQQATINNERVTIQPIRRRQNSMTAGSSRPYASVSGGSSGKHKVIVCYNCKGEGYMSKQCTKPKRKRDAEWFKDKRPQVHSMQLPTMLLIKLMNWMPTTLTVM